MNKTRIVYQNNSNDTRYVALTLNQLSKAIWSSWKQLCGDITTRQVRVEFATDTTFEDNVSNHHGLILQSPFDSLILITGGYGGYDFDSIDLSQIDDELGFGTEWRNVYPDMSRREVILLKGLEKIIWDEWKDENGLLWCEDIGCIERYIDTLGEDEFEVINNI